MAVRKPKVDKSSKSDRPSAVETPVDALRRLRDEGVYPARVLEWGAAACLQVGEPKELLKLAASLRPRVVLKKEARDTYVVFEEDVDRFLDITQVLAALKAQGDPNCYPPGRTRVLAATPFPRGWGAMVERRLTVADTRPIPGVIARKVRRGKAGALTRFALSEDAELLELLCLNADALRRRVLGLWVELQKLRAGPTPPAEAQKNCETRAESIAPRLPAGGADVHEVPDGVLRHVLDAVEHLSRASAFHEVKISALREELQDAPREMCDRALRVLGRQGRIDLVRLNDRSVLLAGEEDLLLKTEVGIYYAAAPRKETESGDR